MRVNHLLHRRLYGRRDWIGATEATGKTMLTTQVHAELFIASFHNISTWTNTHGILHGFNIIPVALFRSFGVRTLLFDFRTSPETAQFDDFYHKGVVDFLFVYFQQGPIAALHFPEEYRPRSGKSGTTRSMDAEDKDDPKANLVLPVYMQYQGHSRTVVGVEEMEDGERYIVFFDPIIDAERFGYDNPVNR